MSSHQRQLTMKLEATVILEETQECTTSSVQALLSVTTTVVSQKVLGRTFVMVQLRHLNDFGSLLTLQPVCYSSSCPTFCLSDCKMQAVRRAHVAMRGGAHDDIKMMGSCRTRVGDGTAAAAGALVDTRLRGVLGTGGAGSAGVAVAD
jgi:hypothetical protein